MELFSCLPSLLLIHFSAICFTQCPELLALINSQVSRLFTPPVLHTDSLHTDQTLPSGDHADRRTMSQALGRHKVRAYRKRGGGAVLYRPESHLSQVQQDVLTSHLGLNNSSVSVTDEPAHRCKRAEWLSTALTEALVTIGCAVHIFCIMYKVFNGSSMGCACRISE